MQGLLRLLSKADLERVERWLGLKNGRAKFIERLKHKIEPDPSLSFEPPRHERDTPALLQRLRRLGAPETCYIVASDGHLDDTFQPLAALLGDELGNFSHGTFVSCVPGRLALFRSAFPFRHLIVHRGD